MKTYYTEKEFTKLKNEMVIIHDSREKSNEDTIKWLENKKIQHEERALSLGDYSFKLKASAESGFLKDAYFTDELFIERKNSLDELAQSMKEGRFHRELREASVITHKYLIVEGGSWEKILDHDYQSKYDHKALWNGLQTEMTKYDIRVIFLEKKNIPQMIYSICKSVLERQVLKAGGY